MYECGACLNTKAWIVSREVESPGENDDIPEAVDLGEASGRRSARHTGDPRVAGERGGSEGPEGDAHSPRRRRRPGAGERQDPGVPRHPVCGAAGGRAAMAATGAGHAPPGRAPD